MLLGTSLPATVAELLHLARRGLADLVGPLTGRRADLRGAGLGDVLRGFLGDLRSGGQLRDAFPDVAHRLSGSLADVAHGRPCPLADIADGLSGTLAHV